jgi:hypothetical protein
MFAEASAFMWGWSRIPPEKRKQAAVIVVFMFALGIFLPWIGAPLLPYIIPFPPSYVTYTNTTVGVTIQHPFGWNVTEGGSNGSIVTFSEPKTDTSILLSWYNESGTKESLKEFKNVTVSQFFNDTTLNYTLVSTEKTTLAGMPAYNLTLTATNENGVAITQTVMMTEKDYEVCALVFSATSESFPTYQNDFSTMTNSFAITS